MSMLPSESLRCRDCKQIKNLQREQQADSRVTFLAPHRASKKSRQQNRGWKGLAAHYPPPPKKRGFEGHHIFEVVGDISLQQLPESPEINMINPQLLPRSCVADGETQRLGALTEKFQVETRLLAHYCKHKRKTQNQCRYICH